MKKMTIFWRFTDCASALSVGAAISQINEKKNILNNITLKIGFLPIIPLLCLIIII